MKRSQITLTILDVAYNQNCAHSESEIIGNYHAPYIIEADYRNAGNSHAYNRKSKNAGVVVVCKQTGDRNDGGGRGAEQIMLKFLMK